MLQTNLQSSDTSNRQVFLACFLFYATMIPDIFAMQQCATPRLKWLNTYGNSTTYD